MGDPRAMVPYHDPHDDYCTVNYAKFVTDTGNPSLANVLDTDQPSSSFVPPSTYECNDNSNTNNDQMDDPLGPLYDPELLAFVGNLDELLGIEESSPSTMQGGGQVSSGAWNGEGSTSNSNSGMPTAVWPQETVSPLQNCNCQVLREIIHTEGDRTTKIKIHGIVGAICHAVLENENFENMVPRYQMIDLRSKSLTDIKQMLQQYCDDKMMAGWFMLTDPLSAYYEALSVGLDWAVDDLSGDDLRDRSATNSGENRADKAEGENEVDRLPTRSHLAQQRERTAKMTLRDLDDVFHLTINQAAKRMNLCTTVIKKICRKYGMDRWPQRKVKSIRRKMATERMKLNSEDARERASAEAEIQRLQIELDIVCKRSPNQMIS